MNTSRFGLVSSVLLTLTGCGLDAVVGGNCKPGFMDIGDRCVPASTSSASDPTTPAVTGTVSAPAPAAAPAPAPAPSSSSSSVPAPSSVAPPPVDPTPADPTPADPTPVDPTPSAPTCDPPLVLCRGECISVDSDPLNCGACGRICPSNLCTAGRCVGSTPGDIVVVGHAVSPYQTSVHDEVVANAVAIPTTEPIRVLSFEAGAAAEAAAWTKSALSYIIKRPIQFTTAPATSFVNADLYASYDVVLVHGAAVDDPAGLGATWATSLQTFTRAGGVFVAIDGGESDVPAFLGGTGLLDLGAHAALPPTTQFVVTTPNDVVGAHLLSPFAAFGASVAFPNVHLDADSTAIVATDDAAHAPTVIHRVAR